MPAGRPSKYTDEIAEKLCERIANGESLYRICKDDEMPDAKTVYTWLAKDVQFLHKYSNARERQADFFAEQCKEIADDKSRDMYFDGRTKSEQPNNASSRRDELRIKTRQWLAAVSKPHKYGTKNQQTLSRLLSHSANEMADEILKKLASGDMSVETADAAMKVVAQKMNMEQATEMLRRLEELERKSELL